MNNISAPPSTFFKDRFVSVGLDFLEVPGFYEAKVIELKNALEFQRNSFVEIAMKLSNPDLLNALSPAQRALLVEKATRATALSERIDDLKDDAEGIFLKPLVVTNDERAVADILASKEFGELTDADTTLLQLVFGPQAGSEAFYNNLRVEQLPGLQTLINYRDIQIRYDQKVAAVQAASENFLTEITLAEGVNLGLQGLSYFGIGAGLVAVLNGAGLLAAGALALDVFNNLTGSPINLGISGTAFSFAQILVNSSIEARTFEAEYLDEFRTETGILSVPLVGTDEFFTGLIAGTYFVVAPEGGTSSSIDLGALQNFFSDVKDVVFIGSDETDILNIPFGLPNSVNVVAGKGNDVITIAASGVVPAKEVTVDGGDGNDTIDVVGAKVEVFGRKGEDIISSGVGNNRLDGGEDNDTLYGGIRGPDGKLIDDNTTDILIGGEGADTIHVGRSDIIVGADAADKLMFDGEHLNASSLATDGHEFATFMGTRNTYGFNTFPVGNFIGRSKNGEATRPDFFTLNVDGVLIALNKEGKGFAVTGYERGDFGFDFAAPAEWLPEAHQDYLQNVNTPPGQSRWRPDQYTKMLATLKPLAAEIAGYDQNNGTLPIQVTGHALATVNYMLSVSFIPSSPNQSLSLAALSSGLAGTTTLAAPAALAAPATTVNGTNDADYLEGTSGDDVLDGGLISDILVGGAGSDGYVWQRGQGDDSILEFAEEANDIDRLFLIGVDQADVTLNRIENDLFIVIGSSGSAVQETIFVPNQFVGGAPGSGIEEIIFDDDSVWDRPTIATEAGEAFNLAPLFLGLDGIETNTGEAVEIDILPAVTDPDGDTVTLESVTVSNGTIELTPQGTYLYTPTTGFSGNERVQLVLSDGTDEATSSFDIAVGVNKAPIAIADGGFQTTINAPLVIQVGELVANDFDPDNVISTEYRGGPSDAVLVPLDLPQTVNTYSGGSGYEYLYGSAENDLFIGNGDGDYLYGYGGSDVFQFSSGDGNDFISDKGTNAADTDVLWLTDLTLADITLASSGSSLNVGIVPTGETIEIDGQFVLGQNGQPPSSTAVEGVEFIRFSDGTALELSTYDFSPPIETTLNSVQNPSNGLVMVNGNGEIVFTPDDGFTGTATFEYTISDTEFESSAQVSIEVLTDNSAPVANDDVASTAEDTPLTILAGDLLSNDTDDEGDPLNLVSVQSPSSGLVIVNGSGDVEFTPDPNFNGPASFTYTINDGEFTSTATVAVNVESVNDAPVVAAALADQSSDEDTAVLFTLPAGSFSDVDGDALTLTATLGDDSALPSWLIFDGTAGTFSGTPPQDFNGSLDVKVIASDGALDVADTFTLAIEPVNDAPVVATALTDQSSDEDTTVLFALPAGSFSDVDGDALSLSATQDDDSTLPPWLIFDGTAGTFSGTPPQDFNGSLDVKVIASDGSLVVSDTFTLTIEPVNDAPSAVDDAGFETTEGTDLTISQNELLANDIDVDANSLIVTEVQASVGGIVQLDPAGDIVFTPEANFTGIASFSYTITDGELTAMANVDVSVVDGSGTVVIDGTNWDDFLEGTQQAEIFNALAGWDVIYARGGDDIVFAGKGSDTVFGNAGNDMLYGQRGHDWLFGGGGNDILKGGLGDDDLEGGMGNDTLLGGRGWDILRGGRGDDTLEGGKGFDVLRGQLGDDRFIFNSDFGVDEIYGFQAGDDTDDVLVFGNVGVENASEVLASSFETNFGTTIDLGDAGRIKLAGVNLVDLSEDDFEFV